MRQFSHPFTCNKAVAAQAVVDAKPPEMVGEECVTNVLVGVQMGKDKTEVERMQSVDPTHVKLLNTGDAQWYQRQSKILLALSPAYHKDPDEGAQENARAKQRQYQKSLALVLIGLEACARTGILCHHRSYPAQYWHMPLQQRGACRWAAYSQAYAVTGSMAGSGCGRWCGAGRWTAMRATL